MKNERKGTARCGKSEKTNLTCLPKLCAMDVFARMESQQKFGRESERRAWEQNNAAMCTTTLFTPLLSHRIPISKAITGIFNKYIFGIFRCTGLPTSKACSEIFKKYIFGILRCRVAIKQSYQ